ncbi:transketolase [uncultured Cyclobacterium sp.]|mgnify:CR=1 FL=1|uniref:transketolase n=1 Tax=uncultured Cyclobacterium sp. TaxID=453820 RepID=UPI0030EDC9FB
MIARPKPFPHAAKMNILCRKVANTIRGLSMDGVRAANSGHPGLPLGMADVAAVLWTKYLKHNPNNPNWYDRDRFVLSAGHGSMLIYSLLHLFGYKMPIGELKKFRQWGSITPGHPENFVTKGVETTTGPLGQGLANGVGMALAEASLAARFNTREYKITNHYTYVIASDGDLQEGISHEVCSFAGPNKLGKLIVFYDNNNISIDGSTDLSYSDVVTKRFEAYHWHVVHINGHDVEAVQDAIEEAQTSLYKPSIIICDTQIGFGSPSRAGTARAHGEPFPDQEIKFTKKNLKLPPQEKFHILPEVRTLIHESIEAGKELENEWINRFKAYEGECPEDAAKFESCILGNFEKNCLDIPLFEEEDEMATRTASGKVLNHIAPRIPGLVGGSADLTPSNNTFPLGEQSFSVDNPSGRYIHYGVREHGMGAIMNGLALHGGVLPYAGTFFVFSDYMRPAMRMSALMGLQVIYVLTHDSIGLGEDGPTHQPVAHLTSFRAMPNILTLRPMDSNETVSCWKIALNNRTGPSCLVLTRQKLPVYNRESLGYAGADNAEKGAYILTEDKNFKAIILASGSEVQLALDAKEKLNKKGVAVRVVSVPCTELFDQQDEKYRNKILPLKIKNRVAVEAGATLSWRNYVGVEGKVVGLDRFGASAPYKTLFEKFGITAKAVVKAVEEQL